MNIRYKSINEVLYAVAQELNLHSTSEILHFKVGEKILHPCNDSMSQLLSLDDGALFSVATRELESEIKFELENSTTDASCVPHPPIVGRPSLLELKQEEVSVPKESKLDNIVVFW